jgi:geranylgeranyl pyrophosphate synthase
LKLAPDEYENIARLKSGMLLALPVTSALTIAGAPSLVTEHASSTMQWLGIAYQIQDDLVDLFGLKESRQAGVDLREGRVNLPVIYFNQSLINDPSENYFKSWFESENPPSQELEYWIGRVRDSEAVYHSLGHLNAAVAHASAFMDRLPAELRTIIRSVQAKMLKYTDKIIEKSETATVPDGKTNQIG